MAGRGTGRRGKELGSSTGGREIEGDEALEGAAREINREGGRLDICRR